MFVITPERSEGEQIRRTNIQGIMYYNNRRRTLRIKLQNIAVYIIPVIVYYNYNESLWFHILISQDIVLYIHECMYSTFH